MALPLNISALPSIPVSLMPIQIIREKMNDRYQVLNQVSVMTTFIMSHSLSSTQLGKPAINIFIFFLDGQTQSLWVDKAVYPISHGPDVFSGSWGRITTSGKNHYRRHLENKCHELTNSFLGEDIELI